jgi:hypothetical protein
MALLQGDLAAATAGYRADLAIEEALAGKDPRNNSQAERVLVVHGALGRTLSFTGELDAAANELQTAVTAAESLAPDRAGQREPARKRADLRDAIGGAAPLAGRCRGGGRAVGAGAGDDLRIAGEGCEQSRLAATTRGGAGRTRPAGAGRGCAGVGGNRAAPGPGAARALLAQQPEDRSLLLSAVAAQLELATLEAPAAATARLRRALASCDAQSTGQRDPRLRALRAELLLRLGQQEAGATLARELWRDGYRDAAFAALMRKHAIAPAASANGLAAGTQ